LPESSGAEGLAMLLGAYSRFFLRQQVSFRSYRKHGEPLAFQVADPKTLDVEDVLRKGIKSGKARLVLRNQDIVRLTKLDVRTKDKLAILLFRRSDPNAAAPIFEHGKTQSLRRSDKTDDEAVAISAHLFISLTGIRDSSNPAYRAILEEVPGLGRTYIQTLLADLLSETPYNYTDHRGEQQETYTLVRVDGVKSEKVGGALKNSAVPSVTLVRPANIKGMDTGGLVEAREERMKLVIRATPEKTLGVIKKIQSWMKTHDWKNALIEVAMPENRTRLVSIAREADAADILFVRSEPIDVANPLDPCTETINEELVSKAKEMFAKDEKA
jgi:hypothetical protein